MSYSSIAVRFFNSPKPFGDLLSEAVPHRPAPKAPVDKPVSLKMTTVPSTHATRNPPQSEAEVNESINLSTSAPAGITFAHEDSLPKLPVPDLETTCNRYIDSLAPLQSHREQEDTKAAVQEFLGADGPELQERLKSYASHKTSFIEQFCESSASLVTGSGLTMY